MYYSNREENAGMVSLDSKELDDDSGDDKNPAADTAAVDEEVK